MAKSTRGKSKKAPEPAAVEEIVEETIDAVVEDVADVPNRETDIIDADSLEIEEPSVDEEPSADAVLEDTPETETHEDLPEDLLADVPEPKRSSGFFPLVLGGVVAAGLGVASSSFIFPDGLPFGRASTATLNLESQLKLQAGQIEDLTSQLKALPAIDAGALDGAVSAVGDLQAQIDSVMDSVGAIETRIEALENRASGDGSGVSAAMETELKDLRAALDVQKGAVAQMIEEAQTTKQSAEDTARQTLSRAAMTRILVALESGAAFEDALADVQANSDVTISEALAQTAASGVPSLASLRDSYPEAARAALAAVRGEDTGGGVASFFAKQFGARSVAPREGDDPDAILSRVEAALSAGRIADALAQADALPDGAKAPLSEWMAQAELRLAATRDAEALAISLNSQ